MKKVFALLVLFLIIFSFANEKNNKNKIFQFEGLLVADSIMNRIYEEIKTPFKFGLVLVPDDSSKMVDSPSIFRTGNNLWHMTFIVFDGRGYETWLAESVNLMDWEIKGKLMSFTENTWDSNQKAGYIALQDYEWGGSYHIQKFKNNYWMSYLGGEASGYEAGKLGIGIAHTSGKISEAHEWKRLNHAVISPSDSDARWYDNQTIYKSTVIWDKAKTSGYPFVMFYNAKGSNETNAEAERIAMAVSKNMTEWKRFGDSPVIDHETGISGDAFITKIDEIWVMFYFGAFWKPDAFDRFACSYNLLNWTVWKGEDLIRPSENFDSRYAHKPFVIKDNGIVYHFYCAVDNNGNRGIALATSVDLGKSVLSF